VKVIVENSGMLPADSDAKSVVDKSLEISKVSHR
jgi:hypothetical protein